MIRSSEAVGGIREIARLIRCGFNPSDQEIRPAKHEPKGFGGNISTASVREHKSDFVFTVLHKYPLLTDPKSSHPVSVLPVVVSRGKMFPPVQCYFIATFYCLFLILLLCSL